MNKSFLCLFLLFSLGFSRAAESQEPLPPEGDQQPAAFDSAALALEHVKDSHSWHLMDYAGHPISISLPVILWDNGLVVFMSSAFEHGHKVVEKNGRYYKIVHEKIYKTDAEGTIEMDGEHPLNERPIDLSITKNVASMIASALLIFILFAAAARGYRKSPTPPGIAKFLEPLVVFVRDDIALPNIGEKKTPFFMPYLLTVFFFIWFNNLIGLLPIPPGGGANVTGNIAVTLVLAVCTFLAVNIFGNKTYWRHIFDPLGNTFPVGGKIFLYLILVPVEIIGIFTKPFALTVRLFANITAGHIIILSLTALIFVFKTSMVSIATVPFTLFMNCIELLVGFLQAYIFTLLSALFIGLSVKEHHHEEAH